MIAPFVLHQHNSLEAACSLLSQYGEDARVLAGGSELIIALKLGLVRPKHIIDIKRILDLHKFQFNPNTQSLTIGSLVTHRELEISTTVRDHYCLVAEMERRLANVRVRGVGTLGGNLCFAEPHADPGALLLAYEAKIKTCTASNENTIDIADFYVDYYKTALKEDEILTAIEIPKLPGSFTGSYYRFCPGERPICTVAAIVGWNKGKIEHVRLALGCVGPTPIRALQLERNLIGQSANEILVDVMDVGQSAALLCDPLEDTWGSKEYKRQIVGTLVMRAFTQLCEERTVNE